MNYTQIRTCTTPLRAACPWPQRRWTRGCARGRTPGRRCEWIKNNELFLCEAMCIPLAFRELWMLRLGEAARLEAKGGRKREYA